MLSDGILASMKVAVRDGRHDLLASIDGSEGARETWAEPSARSLEKTRMVRWGMPNARVFHWNGTDLPDELRELPAGTYVVEAVDEVPLLTEEEEAGLEAAFASMHAGRGRTIEQVQQTIESILRR